MRKERLAPTNKSHNKAIILIDKRLLIDKKTAYAAELSV